MIFKYRVNYDGTYYEAGQDVPIETGKNRDRQNVPASSAPESPQEKAEPNIPDAPQESVRRYTPEELEDMTVREIRAAASNLGFEIKKTSRDDVVNEFLEKQGQM